MELSREEKPREKRVVHIVGSLCCLRWGVVWSQLVAFIMPRNIVLMEWGGLGRLRDVNVSEGRSNLVVTEC